jgi:hypothetical protein
MERKRLFGFRARRPSEAAAKHAKTDKLDLTPDDTE